jgi:hypothetical protein
LSINKFLWSYTRVIADMEDHVTLFWQTPIEASARVQEGPPKMLM